MNLDRYKINLNKFSSENLGSLFVLDKLETPFVPQRVFFVHNVPQNSHRGVHAHKLCKQLVKKQGGMMNRETIAISY